MLQWDRHERATSHFGSVFLHTALEADTRVALNRSPDGEDGTLVAVVMESRENFRTAGARILDESTDIVPPQVDQEIILGHGRLFFRDDSSVGVKPSDGREDKWLDESALQLVQRQTVSLFFCQD